MCLVCLGLLILLYVPDTKAVLARMFFGEQFHHFDGCYLAPAWAFAHGSVLNVDVMTEYGIGVPVFMAWVTKLMGGLSYTHAFWFLIRGNNYLFYVMFCFLAPLARVFGLALSGVLLAIKFQMFHFGVDPVYF